MLKVTRRDGREIELRKSDIFGIRPSRFNKKHTMIVMKSSNYVTVRECPALVAQRLGKSFRGAVWVP